MADKLAELKQDITELELLEQQATRKRVKDLLSIERMKLLSELSLLGANESTAHVPVHVPVVQGKSRYEVKLNNYAWDQSNSFVKFYVTLNKVHTIPSENVKCAFTEKSLELKVSDLEGKDYVLKINGLLHPINPQNSTWKVKTDMVIISAAKKQSVDWPHVTQWEKKTTDTNKFSPSDSSDPSESLMTLMKDLYEKGDDEMKRTIAKAWTEGQDKRTSTL